MPFIGVQPASALLTSADIQDGQITTAKIADTAVTTAKINDDAVTGSKIENSPTIANGLTLTDGDISLASGHGLNFASTSDASGQTSELLDDYEEGEWTPNPEGSSTAGTYSNSYRKGRYVKIGTIVHISGIINGSITGHGGFAYVTGLPYSCVNEDTPTLSVQWNNMPFNTLSEIDHQTIGLISGSHIYFRANDRRVNEAYAGVDWGGGSPQSIGYLRFSGTYRNA